MNFEKFGMKTYFVSKKYNQIYFYNMVQISEKLFKVLKIWLFLQQFEKINNKNNKCMAIRKKLYFQYCKNIFTCIFF